MRSGLVDEHVVTGVLPAAEGEGWHDETVSLYSIPCLSGARPIARRGPARGLGETGRAVAAFIGSARGTEAQRHGGVRRCSRGFREAHSAPWGWRRRSRGQPLVDRGHGQLEVGLGQAGNDLSGERHVVGERGVTVSGPQQQGEAELRGSVADVSPPEALRGVCGDGQRFRRVEASAGEVDLAARDELDQDLDACAGSDGSDESPDGHALAMDERLVAYSRVVNNMASIIALQTAALEEVHGAFRSLPESSRDAVLERVREGRLQVRVVEGHVSHAKIFLLSDGPGGDQCVLTGSANFSTSALLGDQHEVLIRFRDARARQATRSPSATSSASKARRYTEPAERRGGPWR